jgi:hypothetical protein
MKLAARAPRVREGDELATISKKTWILQNLNTGSYKVQKLVTTKQTPRSTHKAHPPARQQVQENLVLRTKT